jgi:hypothetical protein
MIYNNFTNLLYTMMRQEKMDTMRLSLLFLFMTAVTNTSFAGQGDDGKQAEPECDYISVVETT